jgi:hypothetical protein
MLVRLVTIVPVVVAASLLTAKPSAAQRTSVASAEVRVIKSEGTPEEQPLIQAITTRVKTRLSTDAALVKRWNDAIAKQDFVTARAVMAEAAQLKPEQVVVAHRAAVGLERTGRPIFRLASLETYNPFYILLAFETKGICFGLKDTCVKALTDAGYVPNV